MGAGGDGRASKLFFGLLFAAVALLTARILLPLLTPVVLGAFLAVLGAPWHGWLLTKLGGRRALAAGLATGTVFALVLLPIGLVGYLVARELVEGAAFAQQLFESENWRQQLTGSLPAGFQKLLAPLLQKDLGETVMSALAGSAGVLSDVLAGAAEATIQAFVMTVATYYFFLDGRRLFREAVRLLPLQRHHLETFSREFQEVSSALLYGSLLTGMVQGVVGYAGLWMAKVDHAHVWALAMLVGAFIPVGGTALVWLPLGLGLLAAGRTHDGLFLLGWGALVVGTVDNLVRPVFCGSRMSLHPLLVFLTMFGGLAVFGLMGLLVGPLVGSLLMAMIRIYRREFVDAPQQRGEAPILRPDWSAPVGAGMDVGAHPK